MKLTGKQYGIVLLVVITAILHLAAAFDKVLFPESPDPLFILNGLGYFGLLGAYFLPIQFFSVTAQTGLERFIRIHRADHCCMVFDLGRSICDYPRRTFLRT